VMALLGLVTFFSVYERKRSRDEHFLATSASLVYSSIFPFTISIGKSHRHAASPAFTELNFMLACLTMAISTFNPTLHVLSLWITVIPLIHENLYFSAILYATIFGAISNTAEASFNFEEVSLISQAVTHTLLYVVDTSRTFLEPHEIFLPALTFGMLISISPAVPMLRKIKMSSDPIRLAISSYVVVIGSIFLIVRPWLVFELAEDPIAWVWNYMTSSEGYKLRLAIVGWWLIVLAFGILVPVKFFNTTSDNQDNGESLNKRRKFFHGIVVLLFLPALNLDVCISLCHLIDRATSHPSQCHLRHRCSCLQKLYAITRFLQSVLSSQTFSLYSRMSAIHEVHLSLVTSFCL